MISKKYKFIDIGCGINSVSSDIYGLGVNGMFIEPVKQFLDVLPNSNTITKVNVAIGAKAENKTMKIYLPTYSNLQYISSYSLEKLKFRNDINRVKNALISGFSTFNDVPTEHYDAMLRPLKDGFEEIVVQVKVITLLDLIKEYDIYEIDHLKIDVEGDEEIILLQIISLLEENKIKINNILQFECNRNVKRLESLANIIANMLGYKIEKLARGWDRDILIKNPNV
jgi:FkbM family methyltransferase